MFILTLDSFPVNKQNMTMFTVSELFPLEGYFYFWKMDIQGATHIFL